MNFKEIILPVLVITFVVVAIACALTGVSVWQFSNECASSGGNFTNEGFTAWCRY